jgi:hypothetical protein
MRCVGAPSAGAVTHPGSAVILLMARAKYPALMAYIDSRSSVPEMEAWAQLRPDEQEALQGRLGDVVNDLERARVDYKAQEKAAGRNGFPYNKDMGIFHYGYDRVRDGGPAA